MTMKTRKGSLNYIWYVSATLLLFVGATAVHAQDNSNARISITSEGQASQRSDRRNNEGSLDELEALITEGSRSDSTRSSNQKSSSTDGLKPGSVSQSVTPNVDFWFYDVEVELSSDFDRDGYYSSIDLTFDADTVYNVADVYAVIYLSLDYGPWNEYAVTDDFVIYGASGDDEYFVETDLVAGYVSGDYDVLIELFDAYDGTFVASMGPEESSKLSFLPLEDAGRDTPPGTTVIINEGGGGAFSWFGLLALLGIAGGVRLNAIRRA
jgi:hypothetical protein